MKKKYEMIVCPECRGQGGFLAGHNSVDSIDCSTCQGKKKIKVLIRKKEKRFCDENCNQCPIIIHSNSRMLTHILNLLYDKFGDKAYKIVQDNCPNFTVCYDCRIDDFCHIKGCKL